MMSGLKNFLRSLPWWVRFQEWRREGVWQVLVRRHYQRRILDSSPVVLALQGETHIHVLTWKKDYLNVMWALKSFYHFAQVDFPLTIHDGGLTKENINILKHHFPNARVITRKEADLEVEAHLQKLNLPLCLEYRKQNVATIKVFDYTFYSQGKYILHIDSDVIFFKKPQILLERNSFKNRYNRDCQYAYSLDQAELEKVFNINPPPLINSGLFCIQSNLINFQQVEKWLSYPPFFANKWVTEQTIHALAATIHGVELLSDQYLVDVKSGPLDKLVCKHYPGYFRPLFYREGIRYLIRQLKFPLGS